MWQLLRLYSLTEWWYHPWRTALGVIAIMLGVALGFSVHLVNHSALGEFTQAVRAINGEPDFEVRAATGMMNEGLFAKLAMHPAVDVASAVIEIDTYALRPDGTRQPLRVIGIDPLTAGSLSPALVPRLHDGEDRLALFAADAVFVSAELQKRLQLTPGSELGIAVGVRLERFRVAGSVNIANSPVAVMDIATAQWRFGSLGQISRIDVRLKPGTALQDTISELQLPEGVSAVLPTDAPARISNLSRAYRVNLTVLALVALFTGSFLVFSITALSVAKRTPQLALLAVLGLTAAQRRWLIVLESLVLGASGALLGLVVGGAMAVLALRWLGGDLGGGYFTGVAPALQWSWAAAASYGALGIVAAVVGGWLPAAQAAALPPAQALKSTVVHQGRSHAVWFGPILMLAGGLCALAPPVHGLPVMAYAAVALLLIGGIASVPLVLRMLTPVFSTKIASGALAMLAAERALRMRQQATVAICTVVASLSLAVALTVMVTSFRSAVSEWLNSVLPADVYVRTARTSSSAATHYFSPLEVQRIAGIAGIARVEPLRSQPVSFDARQPNVVLLARPLNSDPQSVLPMVGDLLPAKAGVLHVFISEAIVDLYGVRPGGTLQLPLPTPAGTQVVPAQVRGVWRDFSRQHGSVVMDIADWQSLTSDMRVNDLAVWLAPGAAANNVQQHIRNTVEQGELLETASAQEIRKLSLDIFDRSFAVTYWLQALAVGIGLFGVAASFSAQTMARRKEFGMLAHLGYTRTQLRRLVALEGAAWTSVGIALGLVLGLAVSVVLVHVINPQSFHWTMELQLPLLHLIALSGAMLVAGTMTAAIAGREAAGANAVIAVREDW
jgi:putative ABC transport system permease protein